MAKKFEFTLSRVSTRFATITIEADSQEEALDQANEIAFGLSTEPDSIMNYTKKGWSEIQFDEVTVEEDDE
jgi:hypothetical protein